MPDVSPLLPAFFWSGVIICAAWVAIVLPAALESFSRGADAVHAREGEGAPP